VENNWDTEDPGFESKEYSDTQSPILAGLTSAQADAVTTKEGPLLVVAGPGSGKTRVLTHRIAVLVQDGVYPSQILAVTFTNKAAAEMRSRISSLVGPTAAERMWVGTFHAVCLRLLRPYAELAGLPPRFLISDEDYSRRLIESVLTDRDPGLKAQDAKLVGAAISWAKNRGLHPNNLPSELTEVSPSLADDYQAYQERLASLGMADFDDLLLTTCGLLEKNPEVLDHYRERFEHVLVDEVQDANSVQLRLADLLSSRTGNLCVVGDLDQSIYAWRGASPSGMEHFEASHPGTKVVVLEQNFRSTPQIVEVCNAVIARNRSLHRPKLFTQNPTGQAVRLFAAIDEEDEARWIIDQILHSTMPLSQHAILVRTNSQTRPLEEQLLTHGLSYRVIGGLRFYDRAEVKDALAWLRIAVNPNDAFSLARAIVAPRRKIGERSINQILKLAAELNVNPIVAMRDGVESGTLPSRLGTPIAEFLGAYDTVVSAAHRGPQEALEAIRGPAGLADAVQARPSAPGQDRVDNLDELIRSATDFKPTNTVDNFQELSGLDRTLTFVEHAALVSATDNMEGQGVTIITTHAAKGLEFDSVFVAGVEAGLFPHSRSVGDPERLAEERRLLFVAVSRAALELTLTYCDYRNSFSGPPGGGPSPYLLDLPKSVTRLTSDARSTTYRHGRHTAPTRNPRPLLRTTVATPALAPKYQKAGPRIPAHTLKPGDKVSHPTFGAGVVEAVDGNTAIVSFSGIRRKLLLAYAPLKKVPDR